MANRGVVSVIQLLRRVTFHGGRDATDAQLLQRFATARYQDAFAALVQRHGQMVWNVCQRVLHHTQDAEDAFQATFLVLARRADSIVRPHLLGNWLYGVAYRIAMDARGRKIKRAAKERQVVQMPTAGPSSQAEWSDLRPVLDEEVNGLPNKYRVPFVLCYLEGKTNQEASRLIGCPAGTVMSRLAWARERLRLRLSQRGITLSTGLSITALTEATMPPLLADATIKAATLIAAGQTVTAATSANVAALTQGVLNAMMLTKLKYFVLVLLFAVVVGVIAGGLLFQARAVQPGEQADTPAKTLTVKGSEFDDIADILNLFRRSGRVTLSKERRPVGRLVVDFYQDGKKQPKTISGAGFNFGDSPKAEIEFSVQALDMDYLVLGNGKKDHCRVQLKVAVGGSLASTTEDVPKELFDFSKARSGASFRAEASSGKDIPLFWVLYNSNTVSGANTVQAVVEQNQKGKLAIVSLRFDD